MKNGVAQLPILFLLLFSSCSTPMNSTPNSSVSSASPNANRLPASFCNPMDVDLGLEGRINSDPVGSEKKRQLLMSADVQTYIRATELTHEFDAMLDERDPKKKLPLEKIYQSEVYMQLMAVHDLQKKYRHELEDYFAVRIRAEAGPGADAVKRTLAVHRVVDSLQQEFEAIIKSQPDSRYARLALLDIQDDLEDLRAFNTTCNHDSVYEAFTARVSKREAQVKEIINSMPIVKNAHKFFAPRLGSEGVDVGALIKKNAQELREQIHRLENRTPQANLKIEPSAGPNGNMFGDKFPAKTWALTYDDGPGATTHLVLDNLKNHKMKATFFMISQNLQNPDFQKVAKQNQSDGNALACHSMTHPQIPKLDEAGRTREIVGAKKVFTDFFSTQPGDTPPLFFRLPYGAGVSVPSVRQMIADAKMIHVYWNVDTLDWQDHNPQSILDRTVKQIKQYDRGIILFHDIHPQSVVASELLMRYFEDPANHIKMVTIPEITEQMNHDIPDSPVTETPVATNSSSDKVAPEKAATEKIVSGKNSPEKTSKETPSIDEQVSPGPQTSAQKATDLSSGDTPSPSKADLKKIKKNAKKAVVTAKPVSGKPTIDDSGSGKTTTFDATPDSSKSAPTKTKTKASDSQWPQ